MKPRLILFLLLATTLSPLGPAAPAQPIRPEMRAFWADGFNDGYKAPQQVDELLQRLHDAHCNAIFAQMRKGGDAYYASHYEPWASDDTQHFDALACLIAKAHAMNPPIAVHAWINTCAVGSGRLHPHFHIAQLHADWLSLSPRGSPDDDEVYKIDPGNPDAADWTFRLYLDVARHYPVDGIHFDFVRYGAKNFGYNPVSVARFQQRFAGRRDIKRLPDSDLPDPADATWKQWRRDQVTALVRKVYAHAVAINPKIVVSAAVITWGDGPHTDKEWYTKSSAMNRVYQDWQSWLKEGILDLACPMTYFQADYATAYQQRWSAFIKAHQFHRAATVAVGNWFNTIPQSLALMRIARAPVPSGRLPYGVMLYSYAGTNASEQKNAAGHRTELQLQPDFYAALSTPSRYTDTPPFPTAAPMPPMDWKERPRQGTLKGFVLTPDLDPVDGATVRARGNGRTLTQLTDGTGFYALIGLPPGEYRVRVAAPGYSGQEQKATITAGQVTTRPFTLGGARIPLTRSLAGLLGSAPGQTGAFEGTPVRLDGLTVTLGSDTFPGNLYVADRHGVGIRVRLGTPPVVPFQPGDIVSLTGLLRTMDGEPTIDQAVARLTDIVPMSALPTPVATHGSDLAAGQVPNGVPARVQGTVTDSGADGFTVDDAGTRARIDLTGLKDFGVEATGFSFTPPVVGTLVAVTGIVANAEPANGETGLTVRLRVRSPEDVQRLPAAASLWRRPLALGVALASLAALIFITRTYYPLRAGRGRHGRSRSS